MKPLEDLVEALAEAKKAKELLDALWGHFSPYGNLQVPSGGLSDKLRFSKEFQDFLKANELPSGLVTKLQNFYGFDDSE